MTERKITELWAWIAVAADQEIRVLSMTNMDPVGLGCVSAPLISFSRDQCADYSIEANEEAKRLFGAAATARLVRFVRAEE